MSSHNLEDKPMSKLFFEGLTINSQIENGSDPVNCDPVQSSVRQALTLLETVTHRIEQLKLFSINEEASEISTANLKYIITPAVCGELTLLLHTPREERSHVLDNAERFVKQFLERCTDYGFGPTNYIEGVLKGPNSAKARNSRDLTAMNAMREAKIAKFKREKELEERLKHLKVIVGDDDENTDSVDDETVRKYWFSVIEKWIEKSTESFDAISQEKELLEYWKNLPEKGNPPPIQQPSNQTKTSQPKNFILTRDKVQSAVFGAGYPSLPTMTVEEWYDSHAAAGTLPDQGIQPNNGATGRETKESSDEDDEEKLKRQREFDDFKDTHRRGDDSKLFKQCVMELDVAQNWVDVVKKQCQRLQEEEEFHLQLIGEIKKPWLLSRTPQIVQDSYSRRLDDEKKDAERLTKQSQLNEELNNIDNILQKARLLHDTATSKEKPKEKCTHSATKAKKVTQSSESRVDAKQKSGVPRVKHRANRYSKASNTKQRQSESRFDGKTLKGYTVNTQKHEQAITPSLPHEDMDPKHDHSTAEYLQKVELQNIESSAVTIDPTKVKLKFSEFKSYLSLPSKTKKILSNHEKLCEQAYGNWKDSVCTEEISFCRNLCRKSGCDPKYAQLYTRESLLQDARKCIRICINAANILKYPQVQMSPSKLMSKSSDYKSCLVSQSIDIVEEILDILKIKNVELSKTEAIDFDDGIDEMTGWLAIRENLQHINSIDDDLFTPISGILYKKLSSVRKLFNEKLTHQCLTLEYQLSQKITESYFALINRLSKNQKDSVTSPELTHVLQNAYGVLDESSLLLPAFVIEK